MLDDLRWLALEVADLDRAEAFYADHLGMIVEERSDRELRFDAGRHDLLLRRPDSVPRGGLHVHYAMAIPRAEYDERYAALAENFDVQEHTFWDARSLYLDDPDGHCVEFGERDIGEFGERDVENADGSDSTGGVGESSASGSTGGVDHVFEVVLEVRDLDRAEAFYRDLGFETVDRGSERPRVRMDGPVELELWEPHLGLAGARGGVHVDLGFEADDPGRAIESVSDRLRDRIDLEEGYRVLDPDGHWLTIR